MNPDVMTGANGGDVIVRRAQFPPRELLVREARQRDTTTLVDFFDALSFDDRYRRFFSAFRPDEAFAERLATANEHGACQLVAELVENGTTTLIGEAGAWPLPNGNGELGMTVAPAQRGWLGAFLLDALLDQAGRRGMPNLEAEVLATNSQMLGLLRDRGYAIAAHEGFTTARLVVSTSTTVPGWPPNDDRPRVLVETPGGRWSGESTADERGVVVIGCPGPAARKARRPCPALEGRPCPLAAGADAIVVDQITRQNDSLAHTHAALHSGIPVCVQTSADAPQVVELVDRVVTVASQHRTSSQHQK